MLIHLTKAYIIIDMNAPTEGREVQEQKAQKQLSYRADLLRKVTARIPLTSEHLPIGFYRVDLLPLKKPSSAEEEMLQVRNAYSDLSFEYGYPTLPDGRPFWHKLDFEPGFCYGAFQIYLENANNSSGPREISELSENAELLQIAAQIKGQSEQVSSTELAQQLTEYYHLYFWKHRTKAYDIYKEAAYRHAKLKRQISTEDVHYNLAVNLLQQLRAKVLETPKFFEEMSPKTAIDLLGKLVAIQRVSSGLPAAGPLASKESPDETSFEMILRSIAQKAGSNSMNGSTFDQNGNPVGSRGVLSSVLEDKTATDMLQEVIIRVTRASQKPLDLNNGPGRTFRSKNKSTEQLSNEDLQGINVEGAPNVNLDSEGPESA